MIHPAIPKFLRILKGNHKLVRRRPPLPHHRCRRRRRHHTAATTPLPVRGRPEAVPSFQFCDPLTRDAIAHARQAKEFASMSESLEFVDTVLKPMRLVSDRSAFQPYVRTRTRVCVGHAGPRRWRVGEWRWAVYTLSKRQEHVAHLLTREAAATLASAPVPF